MDKILEKILRTIDIKDDEIIDFMKIDPNSESEVIRKRDRDIFRQCMFAFDDKHYIFFNGKVQVEPVFRKPRFSAKFMFNDPLMLSESSGNSAGNLEIRDLGDKANLFYSLNEITINSVEFLDDGFKLPKGKSHELDEEIKIKTEDVDSIYSFSALGFEERFIVRLNKTMKKLQRHMKKDGVSIDKTFSTNLYSDYANYPCVSYDVKGCNIKKFEIQDELFKNIFYEVRSIDEAVVNEIRAIEGVNKLKAEEKSISLRYEREDDILPFLKKTYGLLK